MSRLIENTDEYPFLAVPPLQQFRYPYPLIIGEEDLAVIMQIEHNRDFQQLPSQHIVVQQGSKIIKVIYDTHEIGYLYLMTLITTTTIIKPERLVYRGFHVYQYNKIVYGAMTNEEVHESTCIKYQSCTRWTTKIRIVSRLPNICFN